MTSVPTRYTIFGSKIQLPIIHFIKSELESQELIILLMPAELNFLAPYKLDNLIRIGKSDDGGYLVPETLINNVDMLISFGISTDWSFEEHFKKLNSKLVIHAYDHTISGKKFYLSARKLRGLINILLGRQTLQKFKKNIDLNNSYKNFFQSSATHFEERINNRIDRPNDANLDKVFSRTKSSNVFMKIDIEGSEYRIIDDILRYSERIVGIVLEFHETDPLREVFITAVKKLQQKFTIVHLHGNNCGFISKDNVPETLELTFVKRKQYLTSTQRDSLPLDSLDFPNDIRKPDYKINFNL